MITYTDTEKFLKAIFPEHDRFAVFANLNPPAHVRDYRQLDPQRDCYWSIAAFPPEAITNLGDNALDVRALVIDDVGTKVSELAVEMGLGEPTTIVETSPDNFQWGYRLSKPVARDDWPAFADAVQARIRIKLDSGYNDAVHLFRLPMGVHTKKGNFRVRLVKSDVTVEIDPATIPYVSDGRGSKDRTSSPDGRFKYIRRLVALVPNSTGYHAWIARMYQIWVLAEDKEEGRAAWLEFCERWEPPPISTQEHEYDPADKWDRIREGDTDTLGQLLLDDARAADPDAFTRIMKDEAVAAFDDGVDHSAALKTNGCIQFTPYQWTDPDKIALRDWLYGKILIRKFISMTVAPGGVGKSSLIAVETLAQVTGRNLLGEKPAGKLRVALWNLEDPHEETKRKLQAGALHYGISEADLGDRLFVDSGREQKLVVAQMDRNGGPMIVRPVIRALVEQIRLHRIDIVVVDPFVSCHEVPENDNTAQDMVVKEWGRVAELGNCAIHLIDHTRKVNGAEVTTESSRGGKAKTDAARIVRVVNRMTEIEGKAAGVVNEWSYFRTFNDKANMAPPVARSNWFHLESVSLGNGGKASAAFEVGSGVVPGDDVGVVTGWQWPNAKDAASGDNFQAVVAVMGTRKWLASPRSPDWVGNAVAQALCIDASSISGRKDIKTILKVWLQGGLLKTSPQLDEYRKTKEYIEIVGGY